MMETCRKGKHNMSVPGAWYERPDGRMKECAKCRAERRAHHCEQAKIKRAQRRAEREQRAREIAEEAKRLQEQGPTPAEELAAHDKATEGQHWSARAACTGQDLYLFFTDRYARKALAICDACPVRAQCLQAHMSDEFGVFGGTTPRERRAMGGGRPQPIQTGAGDKRINDEQRQQARALYLQGHGYGVIARKTGMSESSVRTEVVKAGILRDNSDHHFDTPVEAAERERRERVGAKLFKEGYSIRAVGRELNVSYTQARRLRIELISMGVLEPM